VGTVTTGSAAQHPGGEPPLAGPARGRRRLAAWTDRVAAWSASRWVSLALLAAVIATDSVLLSQSWSFVVRAVLDEPCHLLTDVILLGTITRWRGRAPGRPFTWALLVMSVAIDVDHLPLELGLGPGLYGDLPRPVTHALWVPVLLVLAAAAAHRRAAAGGGGKAAVVAMVFAGAAWGVAGHFLRDLATAPIGLLWPVSAAGLQMPYGWYVAVLLVLVALPLRRGRRTAAPAG
jgi:hypothetical protein